MLLGWNNPMLQDRRATHREEVIANQAWVGWLDEDGIHGTPTRLFNISRGGALLVAAVPPPLHQTIWLRIEEPTRTDECNAIVVRHGESNQVGLSFPDSCPFDLHLAATVGINPCGILTR
jgi:hypothetical protein